jgi:hypothetical protein
VIEYIDSPVFGASRVVSDEGRRAITELCACTPVTVFQELNLLLNQGGLCLSVGTVEEME